MRNLLLLAVLALPLAAQQPQLQNGRLATANSTDPHAELTALEGGSETAWLAYTVPSVTRVEQNWTDVTYLEDEAHGNGNSRTETPNAQPYRALVLLRVAGHTLSNIRVADPNRKLDAGGLRVVFLPNVDPARSVDLLRSTAEHATTNRLRDSAVFAVSVHESPATVPALVALAAPDRDPALREKAAFWLSAQHGQEALPILDRWSHEDKDDRFREKLTFHLTLVHQPGATDTLIRMAHQDPAPQVRRQAQFWMSQIAYKSDVKRVAADLADSAVSDPNQDIRKSAVFGLSRLPNGEGTGKMIELAETSKDPSVRKQAVFWLGQSNDPRALDFLTRLIRR